MGATWLLFHAVAAFNFSVPILGRLSEGLPAAFASFGHTLYSALWAYYLFVENDALDVLKGLVPTRF